MTLKAYVENLGKYNEGELVGDWIDLPISEEDFNKVLKEIGIDGKHYEEYFFADYDTDIPNLASYLGEYPGSIDTLNEFAELLDNCMDENEEMCYAAFEILAHENMGAQGIIDEILDNFDNFDFIDVSNDEDLGYYFINEIGISNLDKDTLEQYFDYASYGRDCANDYTQTDYGYFKS